MSRFMTEKPTVVLNGMLITKYSRLKKTEKQELIDKQVIHSYFALFLSTNYANPSFHTI